MRGVGLNRQSRRLMLFLLAFLGPAVMLLGGCSKPSAPEQVSAGTTPAPTVLVAEVKEETIGIGAEFVARTDAVDTVEIRARVEGVLLEAPFEQGKKVTKGQILFRIDPRTFEANLQSAKAQLAKAESDLKQATEKVFLRMAEARLKQAEASLLKAQQDVARIEPLVKEEALPEQELDAAVAQQKVAQADVEAQQASIENTKLNQTVSIEQAKAAVQSGQAAVMNAELDLSYATIESPIDGIIGRTEVSVGNLVGRGEPTLLATVSSIDPIKAVFQLSELDYLRMAPQHKKTDKAPEANLELILADGTLYPDKGTLSVVERAMDPQTGTITVEALFPNPEGLLRPGQFGRVKATVEKRDNAVLVPQLAVVELQGTKNALVVDADNKVALRTVRIGERYENYYVVEQGLKPGERVIVEGLQKARPGMTVAPTTEPLTKEPTAPSAGPQVQEPKVSTPEPQAQEPKAPGAEPPAGESK